MKVCIIFLAFVFIQVQKACAASMTVFAAASLTDVLEEISVLYEQAEHVNVRLSLAASSLLARQIEAGAKPDIFISAHKLWMERLERLELIENPSRVAFLGNTLVVVMEYETFMLRQNFVPHWRENEFNILRSSQWITLLGSEGRIALGDPLHVPAGIYAKEALAYFGLWDVLRPRLAIAEHTRSALNFVIRGETPLGIVYRSDVHATSKAIIVGIFPAASYSAIRYPMAVLRGQMSEQVQKFYDFLQNPVLFHIYRRYGFTVHPSEK